MLVLVFMCIYVLILFGVGIMCNVFSGMLLLLVRCCSVVCVLLLIEVGKGMIWFGSMMLLGLFFIVWVLFGVLGG